jgi:hypothetical protein
MALRPIQRNRILRNIEYVILSPQLYYPFATCATDRKVIQSCLNLLVGEEGQGSSVAQFTDTQKWGDTDNGATGLSDLHEETVLRCLRAPLTELAWIDVNAGASFKAVQALLGKYVAYANEELTPPVAAVHGQDAASSEEELFLMVGWNTRGRSQ